MVVEAAVLVVRYDQQRLIPFGTGDQRFHELSDDRLAFSDIRRRLIVGTARWQSDEVWIDE